MTKAGIYNLCIQKGSTYGPITFRFTDKATGDPIDLSGLNVRAKIRQSYGETATLIDLVSSISDPPGGVITISLPSNADIPDNIAPLNFAQISGWSTKLQLSNVERRLFNTGLTPYVWDLETYDGTNPPLVLRRLNGLVAVTTEVTS